MSSNLLGDAFDIGPDRRRFGPAAWAALAGGLLLFAICVWRFAGALGDLERSQSAAVESRTAAHARAEQIRRTRDFQSSPAEIERANSERRLQDMARMSWFGLFDALETAAGLLRGGVSVTSLTPARAGPGVTQVHMSAVAVTPAAMLDYVRALRADPRILSVELAKHEAEAQPERSVVRFQMVLRWSDSAPGGVRP